MCLVHVQIFKEESNIRKLNIKKHFAVNSGSNTIGGTNQGGGEYAHSGLGNVSAFNPKITGSQHMDVFRAMLESNVKNMDITVLVAREAPFKVAKW